MPDSPLFSICIPTFNRASLLGECIRSALAQTVQAFEVVVVDNASTDDTSAALGAFTDPRLRCHRNTATVGMYANHNRCTELAQADHLVFLHSDDRLAPDALATFVRHLATQPEVDAIYPADREWRPLVAGGRWLGEGTPALLQMIEQPYGRPSGACFRRSTLTRLPFGENHLSEDAVFLVRMLTEGGRLLVVPESTVTWTIGEHQASESWMATDNNLRDAAWVVDAALATVAEADLLAAVPSWSDRTLGLLLAQLAFAGRHALGETVEAAAGPGRGFRRPAALYAYVLAGRWFGRPGVAGWRQARRVLRRALNALRREDILPPWRPPAGWE